jgi:type III restriction enzyme
LFLLYVLCSVANVGSATDIEQFLGRVPRMPYAESRSQEALNRAYAHVSSPRFGEGARSLADTLVQKMGFDPDEAAAAMEVRQAEMPGFESPGGLFDRTPILLETVETAPDLSGLDAEVAARVKVETRPDGTVTVAVTGDIPEALEQRLAATVKPERREALRASVHRHRVAYQNSISPAERGEVFAVPRLFLNVQGELQLAEEELILDLGGWTLNDRAAELSPAEFSIRETAERWEVDLYGEKVGYKHLDQYIQLEIGLLKLDWTDLQLSRWLDRQCRQPDLTQPVLLEFCRKLVAYLVETRRLALNDLVRFKYQLAKAVQQKIAAHRREAYAKGYQDCLFGPQAQVETGFADGFAFDERPYPAAWFYKGAYHFQKHFFGGVGELDSKGEEFECARIIDTFPEVKHWIRNLATRPQTSFWLPTSTDLFYPDFVAELRDGRILVIEYKGEHLADTQDTKEKRNVGQLWAGKSGGMGLFLMAEKRDAQGQDTRTQILALAGH